MAVTGSQLNSIPQFNGASDSDIEAFIDSVNTAIDTYTWDDAQAAGAAKSRLTLTAAKWLRSQAKLEHTWERWQDQAAVAAAAGVAALPFIEGLSTALKRRFMEVINEIGATAAVIDLKQRQSENVDDFFDRCVLAMDKKNQIIPAAQRQGAAYQTQLMNDVYTWFGAGLKEEIRSMALGGPDPPLTAELLLRASKNAEKESQRRSVSRGKMLEELESSNEPEERVHSEVDRMMEEMRAELDAIKSFTGMANVECFRCRKMGHYSFNCPNPKSTTTTAPRGRGAGRGSWNKRGRGGAPGKWRNRSANEMEGTEEEAARAAEEEGADNGGSWQWMGPPGNE